jgi:hypothetical protein
MLDEMAASFWTADEYMLVVKSDTHVASVGIQIKDMKANYIGISATAIFRKAVALPSLTMINRQQLSI